MDLIRQYRSEDEEEDYFEDDDDTWCHEIELPPAKRCRVDENLMDDDMDEWCHGIDLEPPSSQSPVEDVQTGGGVTSPLFTFDVRPSAMPQIWKNIVHKTRHAARLQQSREPKDGDNLGSEMTDAVRRALLSTISLHPNLREHDQIHFTMQTKALSEGNNHCFQSTRFTVAEVRDRGERLAAYLQQLARQLNSGQSFSPGDEFTLETTTIVMPERGSRPKKYDPVKSAVRGIVKRSRISINNKDELCCARAIVTMRAWADEQSQRFPPIGYNTLRDKRCPAQKRRVVKCKQREGASLSPFLSRHHVSFALSQTASGFQEAVIPPHVQLIAIVGQLQGLVRVFLALDQLFDAGESILLKGKRILFHVSVKRGGFHQSHHDEIGRSVLKRVVDLEETFGGTQIVGPHFASHRGVTHDALVHGQRQVSVEVAVHFDLTQQQSDLHVGHVQSHGVRAPVTDGEEFRGIEEQLDADLHLGYQQFT